MYMPQTRSYFSPEVLSDPKIAGQLQKNSSGHATWFFFKKSQNFEIPAIFTHKNVWLCAKPQHCQLSTVKKSISTRCLIISGFIRVNSAKRRSEKIVGQTDRKWWNDLVLSPAKKGQDTKVGAIITAN